MDSKSDVPQVSLDVHISSLVAWIDLTTLERLIIRIAKFAASGYSEKHKPP
jgi:hypothetical protein